MRAEYYDPKIIRLDVNQEFLKRKINPLGNFSGSADPMFFDKDSTILLRLRLNVVNPEFNTEVFGYVSEFYAKVVKENKESDIKDLVRFTENAILNFQLFFEQNTPIEIKHCHQQFGKLFSVQDISQSFLNLIYT